MNNLHQKLTQKYPKYHHWHQTKHHNKIHWGVLVGFALIVSALILNSTNQINAQADTTAPSTPINLTATVVSSSQINLSWTASTDNVGVSGYKIYRCSGSGCAPTVQIATSATNSYSNTGLTASTAYTYAVSAYDATGNESGKSSVATATTKAPGVGPSVFLEHPRIFFSKTPGRPGYERYLKMKAQAGANSSEWQQLLGGLYAGSSSISDRFAAYNALVYSVLSGIPGREADADYYANRAVTKLFGFMEKGGEKGTVTSATEYTLTDSTKSWIANKWVWANGDQRIFVMITGGTGKGQWRYMVSNDSNTLTIDQGWNITPDKTSIYWIAIPTNDKWGNGDAVYESVAYIYDWIYDRLIEDQKHEIITWMSQIDGQQINVNPNNPMVMNDIFKIIRGGPVFAYATYEDNNEHVTGSARISSANTNTITWPSSEYNSVTDQYVSHNGTFYMIKDLTEASGSITATVYKVGQLIGVNGKKDGELDQPPAMEDTTNWIGDDISFYLQWDDTYSAKEWVEGGKTRWNAILKTLGSDPYLGGGYKGGYTYGADYDTGSLRNLLVYVEAAMTASGEDLYLTIDWFKDRIYYLLYHLYERRGNEMRHAEYGYAKHGSNYVNELTGVLLVIAERYKDDDAGKYAQWLMDNVPGMAGRPGGMFRFLFYNPNTQHKPLTELPLAYDTEGIGLFFMRSDWGTNPNWKPTSYLTFKAGDMWVGPGHMDYDQGNVTLYSHNGNMLLDTGQAAATNHPGAYSLLTLAHNSITVFDPEEKKRKMSEGDLWNQQKNTISNDGGQQAPMSEGIQWDANEPLSKYFHNTSDIKAYEDNQSYTYVFSDITNAYANQRWWNEYNGTVLSNAGLRPKVSNVQREFVYLRSSNDKDEYIIILDRVNSTDPSFKKKVLFHYPEAPSIYKQGSLAPEVPLSEDNEYRVNNHIVKYQGDLVSMTEGEGKLFTKVLLPENPQIRKVGGRPGDWPKCPGDARCGTEWWYEEGYEWWIDVAGNPYYPNGHNYPPLDTPRQDGGKWRIEVSPVTKQLNDKFLHVLYPTWATTASMPETLKLDTVLSNMVGAQIKDSVEEKIVLFSSSATGEIVSGSIDYTVNVNTKSRHLLFNLKPNQVYEVTDNDVKNLVSSNAQGVLSLVINSAGLHTIKVVPQGYVEDTVPPTISAVSASGVTDASVSINWTTDKPATSQIEYGATTSYGSTTSLDSSLITSHTVVLSGLKPATIYHYRVISKNKDGYESRSSDYTFTTLSADLPVISAVSVPQEYIYKTSSAINWNTDEPATTQVEYGTSLNYGNKTTIDARLIQTHSLTLEGLLANTLYHFRARSIDSDGNEAISGDYTFTTLKRNPFQEGIDGYQGTEMVGIAEVGPDSIDGSLVILELTAQRRYILLRFNDIIGSGPNQIPPGSQITQASLHLYGNGSAADVYKVKKPWLKGTDAAYWHGDITKPGEYGATWNKAVDYYPGGGTPIPWSIPGAGDIDGADADRSGLAEGSIKIQNWGSVDIVRAVQDWVNGETNNGVILVATNTTQKSVTGPEDLNALLRPKLYVTIAGDITNDIISPTAPTNLQAKIISSSQIDLSWNAATDDNSGVSGYKIYRDNKEITITAKISHQDTGLQPLTTYTYTVSAYDAAGNESAKSQSVSATTLFQFKPSDLNQDQKVDQLDFDILKQEWARTDKPKSDLNQDGIVNSQDLGIMMSSWEN